MTARTHLALGLLSIVSLTTTSLSAQSAFDGCGTIVAGGDCPALFQADSGGLYAVGEDCGGFALGARVRVVGLLDPLCLPLCGATDGCIEAATVGVCAHAVAALCFGDGSGTPCPCAGVGAIGRGCPNSSSAAGARLSATGSPSVAADSLVLTASGMPGARALYFQSSQLAAGGSGQAFGDGLTCVSGTIVRLATVVDASGSSHYPAAGGVPISVRGSVPPGSMRFYQVQYRDVASFCTGAQFNLTNAIQVTWGV
jgi:hypothetical protein